MTWSISLRLLTGCPWPERLRRDQVGRASRRGAGRHFERHLYFVLAIVLVFVAGRCWCSTPLIAWHYRLSNKRNAFRPKWNFSWWLEALIWVPTVRHCNRSQLRAVGLYP